MYYLQKIQLESNLYLIVSILLTFYINNTISASFPKGLSRCHRNDPQLTNCLSDKILVAIKKVQHDGFPELNMSSIEPLTVGNLNIPKSSGFIGFPQQHDNIKIHYLGELDNLTTEKIIFEDDKLYLQINLHLPNITITTIMTATGEMLSIPIKIKGPITIVLHDVTVRLKVTFGFHERHSKTYMKIQIFDLELYPKEVTYNLQNQIKNDFPININMILNDNSMDIFHDVKPAFIHAIELALKNYSNKFFHQIPYHEIFLN